MVIGNGIKNKWEPGAKSFQALLEWLNGGDSSDSHSYETMRHRLIGYFNRKRCQEAAELADQTFDRVAKWLEERQRESSEQSSIQTVKYESECSRIFYTTASFVYFEWKRTSSKTIIGITNLPASIQHTKSLQASKVSEDTALRHQRLNCLDNCLSNLPLETRSLILSYYSGSQQTKIKNRKLLASQMSISSKSLTLRVLRLRTKLEQCVKQCMGNVCEANC